MIRPSKRVLVTLQVLLGAMDCVTGLLLMVAPAGTLRLMGVRHEVEWPVMVSWVGAFVFAVGVTYFLVFSGTGERWRTQWMMTAVVRILVGVFVTWKLVSGDLAMAWVSVAATDLLVGALQLLGLRWGWIERKEER